MLFPQSERHSSFLPGAIRCGREVYRAIIVVAGNIPNFQVEQLTCRSMEAISWGDLDPSEDRWKNSEFAQTRAGGDGVERRKIDNVRDSRKNSVNSFYPDYPSYSYLNRSVRVMGETGSSSRKSSLVLESCESAVENLAVNEEAELLTKLRQRNTCLSAPNR